MTDPKTPRMTGRLTSLFDPAVAVVTEQVTAEGVVLRVEKPRDADFWAEVALSKEWLQARLAQMTAGSPAPVHTPEGARRTAAAAMPAWTPGRELA